MAEKVFNKKMRVQLYDTEFNQLGDRLVDQDVEMYKGPKEVHKGPCRIEFSLFTQEDVTQCISYLQKLQGDLPIEVKVRKSSKQIVETDEGYRENLLAQVKECETQDEAIKLLRSEGFIFLTQEDVEDYGLFTLTKVDSSTGYQWMLKLIREAKDPANNKYDLAIKFGFKIIGDKIDTCICYLFEDRIELECPWKSMEKAFNLKKTNLTKFASFMTAEERMKFSKELAILRRNSDATPSKFFIRWMAHAEFAEKEEFTARFNIA